MTARLPLAPLAAALLLLAACARPSTRPTAVAPAFPFGGAGRADAVAPGLRHEHFVVPARDGRGPWAVHVLRAAPGCRVRALKAGDAAVGRATTSALVGAAAARVAGVVAGVNADFFSFVPPGVPAAAHVEDSRVIAGPSARPVFATDTAGRPWIGVLRVAGYAALGRDTVPITGWNRAQRGGVALFEPTWGPATDSLPGRTFLTLDAVDLWTGAPGAPRATRMRARVDTGAVATLGPRVVHGTRAVLVAGPDAREAARLRAWDRQTVTVAARFAPFLPDHAVGGYPVLVRGGALTADVDTAGSAGFRGVNPRTAVGVTRTGALLLVTVDGRQPGYSAGTTLRETAELMRALGAEEALNLDGGGSTTMVLRDTAGRARVVNRPSDAAGERPVANALAVGACAGG